MVTEGNVHQRIYKEIIPACCNGNKGAEEYLRRVFFIVRTIDDVWDGDRTIERTDISDSFFLLFADIATNTFYRQHQDMLTAIHIVSFNAWQDANEWEQDGDELKQWYAHVLRDYVCELFAFTAYLTGGKRLMRKMSLEIREVFLKSIGE